MVKVLLQHFRMLHDVARVWQAPSQHHTTRSRNVAKCCVEMLRACSRALRKKGFKWSWPSKCCWYEISLVAITGNLRGKGNDRILNRMAITNYIGGVSRRTLSLKHGFIHLFGRWVASTSYFLLCGVHFPLHHSISWHIYCPCYKQL